ncbi:MAG TPA: heavy metal-associated domain-containing protein [Stellaceae bacterium]|nr:heavy metal-associated domain-containing protein [Stellaceae bacterium]
MDELARRNGVGSGVALTITGMSCGGCVGAVKRLLSKVPGVSDVDLGAGRALVAGTARAEDLVAALQGTGYAARPG